MPSLFQCLIPKFLRKRRRDPFEELALATQADRQRELANESKEDRTARLAVDHFKKMPAEDLLQIFSSDQNAAFFLCAFQATLTPEDPPAYIDPNHPGLVPDPSGRCYINELPDEMLEYIFKFTCMYDEKSIRKVCNRWRRLLVPLSQMHPLFKSLDYI